MSKLLPGYTEIRLNTKTVMQIIQEYLHDKGGELFDAVEVLSVKQGEENTMPIRLTPTGARD